MSCLLKTVYVLVAKNCVCPDPCLIKTVYVLFAKN